ncbi:hypothetical protein, partial [Pseudomonas syringae group genomosp. 7]
ALALIDQRGAHGAVGMGGAVCGGLGLVLCGGVVVVGLLFWCVCFFWVLVVLLVMLLGLGFVLLFVLFLWVFGCLFCGVVWWFVLGVGGGVFVGLLVVVGVVGGVLLLGVVVWVGGVCCFGIFFVFFWW